MLSKYWFSSTSWIKFHSSEWFRTLEIVTEMLVKNVLFLCFLPCGLWCIFNIYVCLLLLSFHVNPTGSEDLRKIPVSCRGREWPETSLSSPLAGTHFQSGVRLPGSRSAWVLVQCDDLGRKKKSKIQSLSLIYDWVWLVYNLWNFG